MSIQNEELIKFLTALFEDPAIYDYTYQLGNIRVVFRLPRYDEYVEMQQELLRQISERVITTKQAFRHTRALYKLACSLVDLRIGGKPIYQMNGTLKDRVRILSNSFRTAGSFQLLLKLFRKFEKRYRALIEAASSDDFFDDIPSSAVSSASS